MTYNEKNLKNNMYITESHCCTPENIVNQLYVEKKKAFL